MRDGCGIRDYGTARDYKYNWDWVVVRMAGNGVRKGS